MKIPTPKKPKKLKYNCVVCELHPFEAFVAFEPCDPIFETPEEWEQRRKAHVRSLCNSAAQEDMSWKLCRKHQEQLQTYLIENHSHELTEEQRSPPEENLYIGPEGHDRPNENY